MLVPLKCWKVDESFDSILKWKISWRIQDFFGGSKWMFIIKDWLNLRKNFRRNT